MEGEKVTEQCVQSDDTDIREVAHIHTFNYGDLKKDLRVEGEDGLYSLF